VAVRESIGSGGLQEVDEGVHVSPSNQAGIGITMAAIPRLQ
jgi:hypothetical protein